MKSIDIFIGNCIAKFRKKRIIQAAKMLGCATDGDVVDRDGRYFFVHIARNVVIYLPPNSVVIKGTKFTIIRPANENETPIN